MLVQHRLNISFHRAHVQEPLTCEMTKRFDRVMFNVHAINVGVEDADMRISLIGERDQVKAAKEYFKSIGAIVKTISSQKYTGEIPDVPRPRSHTADASRMIERRLWLTLIGTLRREPFLWMIARRFDVEYKIMQSITGEKMAIISLLAWGPPEEIRSMISYLREQGVNVEFGEISVSAPFTPVG